MIFAASTAPFGLERLCVARFISVRRTGSRMASSAWMRFSRCCQTNANQSQFGTNRFYLGRTKSPPLSECGGSIGLEIVPAVEVALLVEMVLN